jgi:hypothetical protein
MAAISANYRAANDRVARFDGRSASERVIDFA